MAKRNITTVEKKKYLEGVELYGIFWGSDFPPVKKGFHLAFVSMATSPARVFFNDGDTSYGFVAEKCIRSESFMSLLDTDDQKRVWSAAKAELPELDLSQWTWRATA